MAPRLTHTAKLTFALAAAVILLIAGVLLGIANEQDRRSERARELGVQADILSASVTAALAFDDRAAAQEYVDALRVNAQLRAAGVYGLDGALFAGFSRSGPLPPRTPAVSGSEDGLRAVRNVVEGGDVLGRVFVHARPDQFGVVLRRQGGTALLVLMATLFLALLGSAYATLDRRAEELRRTNEALQRAALERDAAEEALVQAKKMEALGQLTGGIAHDFNNLLQAITGSLDLIYRRADDHARVHRLAEVGLQAAERGRKLTSQLLAFSRAPQVQLRTVVVGELIENMTSLLASTLGPLVKLDVDLDPEPLAVTADPVQLEMAVLNLAVNARDAMPEGGAVTLSVKKREIRGDPEAPDGVYVQLRVADTGAGMPPEVRDRAFEPFFTTKGVGAGTGLGLAQVYAVARQAGGTARIDSAPGEGAAVSLLLPKAEGAAASESSAPGSQPIQPSSEARRVLVVDDDFEVRALLRESLQALGHSVVEAGDAAAAMVMLDREEPDLMLVDFAMPEVNGAELATRARERWPHMPILFASGYADLSQVEAALGRDAPLLRKPFSIQELGAAVDSAAAAGRR